MLTPQDVKNLISAQSKVLATKEDVGGLKEDIQYVKEDVSQVKENVAKLEVKVDTLITAVDGLVKLVKDFRDEHIVLHRRIETLEKWAKKVSEQVGIPLPS